MWQGLQSLPDTYLPEDNTKDDGGRQWASGQSPLRSPVPFLATGKEWGASPGPYLRASSFISASVWLISDKCLACKRKKKCSSLCHPGSYPRASRFFGNGVLLLYISPKCLAAMKCWDSGRESSNTLFQPLFFSAHFPMNSSSTCLSAIPITSRVRLTWFHSVSLLPTHSVWQQWNWSDSC